MNLTTIERDSARDFAVTLAACRRLAKTQGRAGAEHVRQLVAATRSFARTMRDTRDRCAEIDRIHDLAQRALARGVAPTSVRTYSESRYARVRLESNANV